MQRSISQSTLGALECWEGASSDIRSSHTHEKSDCWAHKLSSVFRKVSYIIYTIIYIIPTTCLHFRPLHAQLCSHTWQVFPSPPALSACAWACSCEKGPLVENSISSLGDANRRFTFDRRKICLAVALLDLICTLEYRRSEFIQNQQDALSNVQQDHLQITTSKARTRYFALITSTCKVRNEYIPVFTNVDWAKAVILAFKQHTTKLNCHQMYSSYIKYTEIIPIPNYFTHKLSHVKSSSQVLVAKNKKNNIMLTPGIVTTAVLQMRPMRLATLLIVATFFLVYCFFSS